MNKLGSNLGDGRTNSEQTLGLVGCFWIVENYINWLKTVKRKRSQIKHRKCNIRQIEISNKSWIQSYHCCSPPHVHRLSSLWRLSLAMLRWCCCLLWAAVVSLQRPGPASWHWPWLRLQHSTSTGSCERWTVDWWALPREVCSLWMTFLADWFHNELFCGSYLMCICDLMTVMHTTEKE